MEKVKFDVKRKELNISINSYFLSIASRVGVWFVTMTKDQKIENLNFALSFDLSFDPSAFIVIKGSAIQRRESKWEPSVILL